MVKRAHALNAVPTRQEETLEKSWVRTCRCHAWAPQRLRCRRIGEQNCIPPQSRILRQPPERGQNKLPCGKRWDFSSLHQTMHPASQTHVGKEKLSRHWQFPFPICKRAAKRSCMGNPSYKDPFQMAWCVCLSRERHQVFYSLHRGPHTVCEATLTFEDNFQVTWVC